MVPYRYLYGLLTFLLASCQPSCAEDNIGPYGWTRPDLEDTGTDAAQDAIVDSNSDASDAEPDVSEDADMDTGETADTDPPMSCEDGDSCTIASGSGVCASGVCTVDSCNAARFDCDGDAANGCEASCVPSRSCRTDDDQAGTLICDDPCAPTCESRCDDASACTTSCGSMGVLDCATSPPECAPPAEVCDAADQNCDGVCDDGVGGGCRVGVHRAQSGGHHLYTRDRAQADAHGLERANYFWVYADMHPELSPIYRCDKPDGKTLVTRDIDCEALDDRGTLLGYVTTIERCDSVPLYRLYNGGNNNHFYTTSAAERDNAVAMFNFRYENIVAYVFPSNVP